ncbi:MAG: hypothetical protein H6621_02970 [Halobacteriovoraceae bacterium]|nr:hypothetical protein [Halobacteriovoraceae bacterium]MCB9094007.1 hypothetical protein [Halobacteriovoraceae bacterium]
MKLLTLGIVFVFSLSVFAEGEGKMKDSPEMFGERKEKALEHITTRINALTEAKTCISAAQDANALKECNKSAHQKMMAARKNFRDDRKAFKEKMKGMKGMKGMHGKGKGKGPMADDAAGEEMTEE